jgi:hypothetical protein
MDDKPRVLATRAWMYPDGCHKTWGTPERSTDAEDIGIQWDDGGRPWLDHGCTTIEALPPSQDD